MSSGGTAPAVWRGLAFFARAHMHPRNRLLGARTKTTPKARFLSQDPSLGRAHRRAPPGEIVGADGRQATPFFSSASQSIFYYYFVFPREKTKKGSQRVTRKNSKKACRRWQPFLSVHVGASSLATGKKKNRHQRDEVALVRRGSRRGPLAHDRGKPCRPSTHRRQ